METQFALGIHHLSFLPAEANLSAAVLTTVEAEEGIIHH